LPAGPKTAQPARNPGVEETSTLYVASVLFSARRRTTSPTRASDGWHVEHGVEYVGIA
jgi:hypothetical protein